MAQQGPFGADDDGKTVILPNPGGRSSPVHSPPVSNSPPVQPSAPAVDLQLLTGKTSANTLLSLASPLLSLSSRLRVTVSYAGIEQLKQSLLKEVSEFESRALQFGLLPEQVKSASYVLCAYMDEVIQNTPWGVQSNWGHMCLLISVHREAWGGERFFQVLDYALKQASQNVQLVELCYVLLSFGFQGK
jgi:type VI secretion system protein ImpK